MNTSFDITDIDCAPKELEDALGRKPSQGISAASSHGIARRRPRSQRSLV